MWKLRKGKARLLTAVGDDADGKYLEHVAPGLLLDGSVVNGGSTATYAAILGANGECLMGLGDMALHNNITIDLINRHIDVLKQAPMVIIDGNIPQTTMDYVLRLCSEMQKTVFFEPTDQRKATKPLKIQWPGHCLSYASPNLSELRAMATFLKPNLKVKISYDAKEILQLSQVVCKVVKYLIITIGSEGVITVRKRNNGYLEARHYPVKPLANVENVSGAGDCFASGFVNGILTGQKESCCITLGFEAARHALLSKCTVPEKLNLEHTPDEASYTSFESI